VKNLNENATLNIYTLSGKLIDVVQVNNSGFDVTELEKGIYTIRIFTKMGCHSQVLIKK
jgi:hypothetical protein